MNVMRIIEAGSVNEMVKSVLSDLQHNGKRVESRNGGCVSVKNRYLQIDNPRLRHLSLVGRKYNIYAMMAETFWVLAGDDRIGPYLEYFLPRAPDYSDDGITWRGGYGPRIFGNDQVQNIMDIFAKEGPSSRRAVMSIYEPSKDSYESLKTVYGLEASRDIPCNLMLHFFTEHDDTSTLNMRVIQRSGDCFVGDTKIKLFSGKSKSIEQLLEDGYTDEYVYSCSPDGKVIPGKIEKIWSKGLVNELVRVTLDNGKTFTCTPDHLIMLRDGSYTAASELSEGASLMPLYDRVGDEGYVEYLDNYDLSYKKRYSLVRNTVLAAQESAAYDRALREIEEGVSARKIVHTHHADFNKTNDNPSNLECLTVSEHYGKHNTIWDTTHELYNSEEFSAARDKMYCVLKQGTKTRNSSPEGRDLNSQIMTDVNHKMWSNPEFRERMKPVQAENGRMAMSKLWGDKEFREGAAARASVRMSSINSTTNSERNKDKTFKMRQAYGRARKVLEALREEGLSLCEESYNKFKHVSRFAPSWADLVSVTASLGTPVNHKVSKVEFLTNGETEVYDIEISNSANTHNFALDAGVMVHNCLWGLGSINMFEWTLFQEIMANSMGLKLGYYIHEVFDAHLYDKFADQGVAVLETPQQLTAAEAPTRAAFSSQANMQAFYGSLVAELSKLIACEDQSMITQHLSNIGAVLDGQGLDTNDVQRGYVAAVVAYILHKNGYDTELSLPEALSSTNFVQSLQNCVFTKFPISFVKE